MSTLPRCSSKYVWTKVIDQNLRPFFGKIKAVNLTTDLMDEYKESRQRMSIYSSRRSWVLATALLPLAFCDSGLHAQTAAPVETTGSANP
jgi:hypothetical protein